MKLNNVLFILLLPALLLAVAGMFPMQQLSTLPLQEAGLAIAPEEIFAADSARIIDGIVKVGGCSGAFISENGLILTNHHCAYSAIQNHSSAAGDLLTNGFTASKRSEELPAKSYTVRIMNQYQDVSDTILSVIESAMDYGERTKAIEQISKKLIAEAEAKHPDKRAEIGEMTQGKVYYLFLYTFLKDVRLVYAPPIGIGNFGGEIDNWEWPRHTGDFALMRAYTAPDGSNASYHPDNIPYTPKHVISVEPAGTQTGDFVFIAGYPGQTYRHRSASYFQYRQELLMPKTIQWYQWLIEKMDILSTDDPETEIRLASRKKSLANVEKKYRGQQLGMERLNLIQKKQTQEKINSEKLALEYQKSYKQILSDLGEIYANERKNYEHNFILNQILRQSNLLYFGYKAFETTIERGKTDLDRETEYMDRNWELTQKRWQQRHKDLIREMDQIVMSSLIKRAWRLPSDQKIAPLEKFRKKRNAEKKLQKNLEKMVNTTRLNDYSEFEKLLEMSPEALKQVKDPFLQIAISLYPLIQKNKEADKSLKGRTDELYGKLDEMNQMAQGGAYVPDANSTLRLTYGYIEGAEPRDGIKYEAFTTVTGLLEKNSAVPPFRLPDWLIDAIHNEAENKYIHPELRKVPVCMLYSLDTTGGNSGSAVLNRYGRLVGLNFDRALEATINDFHWSPKYSRSIGVDIRYILWILSLQDESLPLLQEILEKSMN
ncbi:MAG TPA: S46 family peptidase [Candidatus Marinimicrobia bacterium]|nr:S46 family peptidase [Candidatus Neomarinimicrobiota bacterium]